MNNEKTAATAAKAITDLHRIASLAEETTHRTNITAADAAIIRRLNDLCDAVFQLAEDMEWMAKRPTGHGRGQ